MISFNFGGENSYDDFGILISKRPSVPSPKRRVSFVNVPGRNSSIKFDEKVYEDITIAVECAIKDFESLPDKIDEIKAWLFNAGESDLVFNFQADRKYMAQVVNSIDFKQAYRVLGQFVIIFNCRPFKYAVTNSLIAIDQSGTSISNPGTIESEPIITVLGSGDITLKINGVQVGIKSVTSKIILNSIIQDCYDDTGTNLNNKMTGEFPKLLPGSNKIEWIGNVTRVEIIPNWRWL